MTQTATDERTRAIRAGYSPAERQIAVGYSEFVARVVAIVRTPLAEALEAIAAETQLQVLTQAMDVCPADRRVALRRRIRQLRTIAPQAVPA
jgi:hypothetical protein